MREYSQVMPQFWTGATGRKIRGLGMAAQLVALYLMTCPSANMIGLYYLPVPTLAHETGIQSEEAAGVLAALEEVGFCRYDRETDVVWVVRMLAYQVGEALHAGDRGEDNRSMGIANLLEEYRGMAFYGEFRAMYGVSHRLPEVTRQKVRGRMTMVVTSAFMECLEGERRVQGGACDTLAEGVGRDGEAACRGLGKPGNREQRPENREQGAGTEENPPPARGAEPGLAAAALVGEDEAVVARELFQRVGVVLAASAAPAVLDALRLTKAEMATNLRGAGLLIEPRMRRELARAADGKVNWRFWFEDGGWRAAAAVAAPAAGANGGGAKRALAMPPGPVDELAGVQTWRAILGRLGDAGGVPRQSLETWLKPLRVLGMADGVVYLRLPNEQFAHVGVKYGEELGRAMSGLAEDVRLLGEVEAGR